MTRVNWTNNNHSGAFVERSLRSLEPYINSLPESERMAALKDYVYVWNIKSQISKSHSLDERVSKLENIAGIAAKQVITQ